MSTATPPQILKRNSRPRKAPAPSAAAAQPQTSHTEDAPNEHNQSTTPNKPKKKKQNQRSQQPQNHENGVVNNNPVSPLTPPRNTNSSTGADTHVSPLATSNKPNGKGKKKNNHNNNNQREGAHASPQSRKSRSPQPEQAPTTTPAKAAQIYAGPTFHASPAPSSLPIPKLFSKSLPQVNNKEASLEAMMQDDVSEESNSQAAESPTLRNSIRAEEKKGREESPLDIFFKADRAEKAQRESDGSNGNLTTPNDKFRAASASPARFASRNHSRRPTDSSIFPLELDGEPGKSAPSLPPSGHPVPAGHENSPIALGKTDAAKSAKLKHLLFSKPQEQVNGGSISPSPTLTPPRTGQSWSPSPKARSRESSPYSSIYGGSLADSRPMTARTTSSHLRQEISPETVSELPITPTPARTHDFFMGSPHTKTIHQQPRHSPPRTAAKFEGQNALKASLGNTPTAHPSTEDMEHKIREILKLGSFSSTGVR